MRYCHGIWTLILAGLAAGCGSRSATEPILVGHVTPLAGPERAVGERARHGVALAVDEVNKEDNRIAGRRVTVLHVDSRGDAETAQAAAVRLLTLNKVTALLADPTDRAQAEELARAAGQYKAALISSGPPSAAPSGENVFTTGVAPAQRGRALARFLKDGLEPRPGSVAVLTDGREGLAADLAEAFLDELKGSPVEARKRTYKSEADVPELADQLRPAPPQAVLVVGASPDFVRRLRARLEGPKAWLYAGTEAQMTALREDPDAGPGVYLATAYVVDNGSDRGKEFAQKYHERFHQDPDVHAALAYDDARLLFEALRQSKVLTPAKVRDELAKVETFEGVTGALKFTKERNVRRPVFLVQVEDGRLKLLKRDGDS